MKSEIIPGKMSRGKEILSRWIVFHFRGEESLVNIYVYEDNTVEMNIDSGETLYPNVHFTLKTQTDRMEFNEIWLAVNMGYRYCYDRFIQPPVLQKRDDAHLFEIPEERKKLFDDNQ